MSEYGWAKTEHYDLRDGESAELAQKLFDTGLLGLTNSVLHHFGLAIGVSVEDDGETVTGLALNLTEDPNGIWYDEATIEYVREKMRRTGTIKNVELDG